MILFYSNDGGSTQRLDASRMRASEIQVIERTADGRWDDIRAAALEGEINAMRVIAWAVLKRATPTLRFGDFDPYEGDLRARLDDREMRVFAEQIYAKYGANPDELAEAIAELRDSAADPDTVDAAMADLMAPKDPAPAEGQPSPASPSE